MLRLKVVLRLCLSLLLISFGGALQAATLSVNCGGSSGLMSINAAIRLVQGNQSMHPATINVSGACHENLQITSIDRLTVNAVNGASITDASNGYTDVVNVNNSSGFTLKGFAIIAVNANNDGVNCNNGSHCTLVSNDIQGGFGGVGVTATATAFIVGGSLHGNTNGLRVVLGDAVAAGVTIQGNTVGAAVSDGGRLRFRVSDPQYDGVDFTVPAVSHGNSQQGISVARGATVLCQGCNVSGNSADGISLDTSASLRIGPYSFNSGAVTQSAVSQNGGSGIHLGDLSNATFTGHGTNISGNAQTDILCVGPTSITRGMTNVVPPATTNCPN